MLYRWENERHAKKAKNTGEHYEKDITKEKGENGK